MKKKAIIISIGVLVIAISVFIGLIFNKEETYTDVEPKQVVQENTLSMMIEQTAGAGDYKLETRSSWPTSGYVFNTTLSKCENGSTLSWDSTNGIVTMTGNVSDKCYVYFDIIVIISFAIDDTTYYAEDGMTWGEWVESDYSNGEYTTFLNCGLNVSSAIGSVVVKNGVITTDTLIVNNEAYTLVNPSSVCARRK